jgi:protein-tyrosine phosphatase
MSYAPEAGRLDVPDPYYGGDSDFEAVLDLTTAASRGLVTALQQRAEEPVESAGQRDRDR